ncbi:MAG: hypothetical protein QW566_00415 [Candidatus Jordarchaeales archaeon]
MPLYPVGSAHTATCSASSSSPSISVQVLNRSVEINSYGLIKVTDFFSIVNTGTEPALFIDVFYPAELHKNLLTVSAMSGEGSPLKVEDVSGFYTGKRLFFDHDVPPGYSYNLTVTQKFANLVTLNASSLYADLYRYPIIPHTILNCTIRIFFPENATPQYPYPSGAIFQNGTLVIRDTNIGAFNTTAMTVKYYGPLLRFEWHFRYVRVDPWRGIDVIDFYKVRNDGPQEVSKLECNVPPLVIQLLAYDAIDVIGAWPEGDHIAITPRIPLEQNDHYIYYVKYKIPMPSYHFGAYDHYVFVFPANPSYETVIPTSTTIVSLSASLSPQATYPPSLPASSGLLLGKETFFLFREENIKPNHSSQLYIYYTSPVLSLYSSPVAFSAALLVIFTSLMFAVKLRVPAKPIAVEIEEEKYALLEELCSLYEEKHLLILEKDMLEQKYAARKVKKFEYTKRASDIEKQLSSLERRISETKSDLLAVDKRYAPDFEDLETAIAQVEQSRAAIEFIKRRYATGKISKETYEKLIEEQEKKKEKSISKAEKKIQELRRRILLP